MKCCFNNHHDRSRSIMMYPVELLRVHVLLPGYPLTNIRRVPGYPFSGCSIFSALKQDQDCQNRPTRSQDMSKFLHESLWNWSVTSFRTTLWLLSRVFTHFRTYWAPTNIHRGLEVLNGVNYLDTELFRGLNGYPGSIWITGVVPLPTGTQVPGYPFTALVSRCEKYKWEK